MKSLTRVARSGATISFSRDEHGNLRVQDFDSSPVPWPERRQAKRERRTRRELKYAAGFALSV